MAYPALPTRVKDASPVKNTIRRVQKIASAAALNGRPGVEVELASSRAFPVKGDAPLLKIGQQSFSLGRYPSNGDTHILIFTLTLDEFAKTSAKDHVQVVYQSGRPDLVWNFGLLGKRRP